MTMERRAMKRNRPTQADVARLAGVSQTTVSMVLNQRDGGSILISEDTAERVHAAMRELGYAPDPVAQMLAQGKNRLLAVFNYDPAMSYMRSSDYHKILVGIENGADGQDYNILLLTRNRADAKRSVYRGGVNTLRLADGAIIMGMFPDRDELRRLTEEGYPFVCIGRREVPGVELNWVISDYYSAGFQATQHLLQLGHRRLGYICDQHFFRTHSSQARISGCTDALKDIPDTELVLIDQTDVTTPERMLAHLREQRLTGLICNDVGNFSHAMQTLSQTALRVPDDVSVLVLGDTSGDLMSSTHATYVRLNQEKVGEEAVKLLVSRIDGISTPSVQQRFVPCDFVVGDTTSAWTGTAGPGGK
jgi:DNA-binding LacI/PurR family transcriptional regulator